MRVEELGTSQSGVTSQQIVLHKETTRPDDSRAEYGIISLAVTGKQRGIFPMIFQPFKKIVNYYL